MKILGHEFKPMTEGDREAFAGANDGTLICYLDDKSDHILLWDPTTAELIHCDEEGTEVVWQIVRA